jgi:hypothetical protein
MTLGIMTLNIIRPIMALGIKSLVIITHGIITLDIMSITRVNIMTLCRSV